MHLTRNFYNKRPLSPAECILRLLSVSTIRANATLIHARTHTPTQYSYIYLLLHQTERTTTGQAL